MSAEREPDLRRLLDERYPPVERLLAERPQPSNPTARQLAAERYSREPIR